METTNVRPWATTDCAGNIIATSMGDSVRYISPDWDMREFFGENVSGLWYGYIDTPPVTDKDILTGADNSCIRAAALNLSRTCALKNAGRADVKDVRNATRAYALAFSIVFAADNGYQKGTLSN